MQAIRLHAAPQGTEAYSPSNPAPTSALHLDTVPIPKPSNPGDVLIKIHATTVIRDMLTWPETYAHEYATPGNDLSGVVVEVFSETSQFKPGDEVFGMVSASRPSTWAEYAIAWGSEIALKPAGLGWLEAAALPLSGLTAYQALFVHGGVSLPEESEARANYERVGGRDGGKGRILVTGAGGGVGAYLVQLARLAGWDVTAASSSNVRNWGFLRSLGADEVVEYSELKTLKEQYDLVVDTVGGQPLVDSWGCVRGDGTLVSVDSGSFDFVDDHAKRGIRREGVKALFFIVEENTHRLSVLARFAELGVLKVFVLTSYPLEKAREAYEHGNGRLPGRGKVVLTV
ncbi:hypothetical protein BJX61DRAFT_547913 [Aspergillus egyptiacus]|nr:hypothetical protein BJX61DRAFT_547913 [Aspergillus egyptiacus]